MWVKHSDNREDTMTESLKRLESKRKALYRRLEDLGDFRRGTIATNYRKCGKRNCACADPEHRGHGPQYLWSTTIKGRSYAKSLKLGPELQKYLEETDSYRVFTKLSKEILQVNEDLCDMRTVQEIQDDDEAEELKKKLLTHFRRRYKRRLSKS
jgi:hypothetical protein